MNCPYCDGKTRVVDSRPDDDSVNRRRECLECKQRFATVEIDAELYKNMVSQLEPIMPKVNEAVTAFKLQLKQIIEETVKGVKNE